MKQDGKIYSVSFQPRGEGTQRDCKKLEGMQSVPSAEVLLEANVYKVTIQPLSHVYQQILCFV